MSASERKPTIHELGLMVDEEDAAAEAEPGTQFLDAPPFPVVARLESIGFGFVPLRTGTKTPPIGVIKGKTTWPEAIAATNIQKTLTNPGTLRAAMTPPPGVVGLDADKGWAELRTRLTDELGPLPVTMTVITPNGEHLFFAWPQDLPQPKGLWWGQVVARWDFRTTDHDGGYTVAPVGDSSYTLFPAEDAYAIATLPREWALNVLAAGRSKSAAPEASGALVEVTERYEVPESVEEGGRYREMLEFTASKYNQGLTLDEMWVLARDHLAPRFKVPKDDQTLRADFDRATKDMESRLGPPASTGWSEGKAEEPVGADELSRIVNIVDYTASVPTVIPWVAKGFAYLGGVTLLSGAPKAGKSTLAAQLQRCRETGEKLFGQWHVASGPTLLVTEEGGIPVVFKTGGLVALDVLDRRAAGSLTFGQVLELVGMWAAGHPEALVFIDTMAIWAGIENENDASQVTRAVAQVMLLAQAHGCAVVLVHHARKSGGDNGEAIRGSGAILATVDISAELTRVEAGSDARQLDVMGRVVMAESYRLEFDRVLAEYTLVGNDVVRLAEIEAMLVGVPAGGAGMTTDELRAVWGIKDIRKRVAMLLNVGRMRSDMVKEGRVRYLLYWSVPPATE